MSQNETTPDDEAANVEKVANALETRWKKRMGIAVALLLGVGGVTGDSTVGPRYLRRAIRAIISDAVSPIVDSSEARMMRANAAMETRITQRIDSVSDTLGKRAGRMEGFVARSPIGRSMLRAVEEERDRRRRDDSLQRRLFGEADGDGIGGLFGGVDNVGHLRARP